MCFYCRSEKTVPSVTTHVVTLESRVIIVKNVPCEVCELCGEKYYSDEVMEALEEIVDEAKKTAGEVFITDYNRKVA